VEHKLVSFVAVVALWTLVTLLIKLIRILLKWKYIQDKNYAIFWHYIAKAKPFSLKSFVPVTRAGVFIWENFHPAYWDLGRKNWDLGNLASLASHINPSTFVRRKEWRGKISETEPARLTGLIWRGPKFASTHLYPWVERHTVRV